MSDRFDRAAEVTRGSLDLAVVVLVATLLSGSKVSRALAAGPGGGITFPFPSGLPTLWTYVSLPAGPGTGSVGGPLSLVAFVPLFLVGLLVTAALEAGFLGTLSSRIDGETDGFVDGVERYTLRMVGVNLLRAVVVFVAAPLLLVFPPLAVVVSLGVTYLIYGLPFEIVVSDAAFGTALGQTVSHALDGGEYAFFGGVHLVAGAVASVLFSSLVRGGGLLSILVGAAIVAVPAVFVAAYGLLVFRELRPTGSQSDSERPVGDEAI